MGRGGSSRIKQSACFRLDRLTGPRIRWSANSRGSAVIWTWIVAAPVVLALVAYAAALLASKTSGLVRIVAQMVVVVLASVTGALVGFLIPLAPVIRDAIGEAVWAGLLGTLGTIGGMWLAETLMNRLDRR